MKTLTILTLILMAHIASASPRLMSTHSNLLEQADVVIVALKCDYRVNPLAVEQETPGLSWRIESGHAGAAQVAYQIQAAGSQESLAEAGLWNSLWVQSTETTQIAYAGKPVAPATRVFWRVQVKDEKGKVSVWSKPAWFETGLRNEEQWQGAQWISCTRKRKPQMAPKELMGPWIGPVTSGTPRSKRALTYRYSFTLPELPVVYAGAWWGTVTPTAIACTVNGDSAKYTYRAHAPKHVDFGFCLHPGQNLVELKMPRPPTDRVVTFGMRIVFADGTERIVRSSTEWKTVAGKGKEHPVRIDCAYGVRPRGNATVYSLAPLPATWYKEDFTVTKLVVSARLYCCGLGYNEPYLNGAKVGDHVLDPGQTDYEEIALYQTFDVTDQVQHGQNALAVLLGDGWYNQDRGFCQPGLRYGKPGLRVLLQIRYADGSVSNVVTHKNWRWRESCTRMSNVYLGDHVDFRLQHDEWMRPGFSSAWKAARAIPQLSPRLEAQRFEPIRKIRTIEPVRAWQTGARTWVFDLGQNISGWVRLKFNEPEGSVLRIRCTEMLAPDAKHLLNVPKSFWWCHGSPQHHRLVCDGKPHTWEPRFSYHGFRYFEVSGLSRAPDADDAVGVVVNTDVAIAATFESADPLLNRIFQMGVQTHLNNMHSILEDCPHREKCMWGGDLHTSWSLGFHALDSSAFYRQLVDLYYTPPFSKSGIPGDVGVGKRISRNYNDFTWAVSPLFLAYRLYEVDGELETAHRHYSRMQDFLRHFEKHAPGLIPREAAHGDHAAPPDIKRVAQDKHLIAAMNFFAAANRFAELAEALGNPADATWAKGLAERIRTAIQEKYYDSRNHTYGNGTHDSLALAFGLPAATERAAVAASLAKVYRKNGRNFDGGFMSYFIYPQLAENGEVDLALAMLRNPDYPGLAWSIANYDATTIWEKFCLDREMREDRSLDHHAMNHPSAWLLTHLAGIQATHRKIVLAPHIPKELGWVRASVDTHHGRIMSSWKQNGGNVEWNVTIPPNCIAEARFPNASGKSKQMLPAGTYQFFWPVTHGQTTATD